MIVTNNLGLPEPIVAAVNNDPYDRGKSDLTVTELIQPARKVALEKLHAAELTEDASDRLWALVGQVGHLILERAGAASGIVEKRYYGTVKGWVLSGRVDIVLKTQTLLDYKFTSIWTVTGGLKPEWSQQVNLLVQLARDHGHDIREAQIVCIFRDWSVLEAKRDSSYPQKQVRILPVPIWDTEKTLAFTLERIAAHQAAQQAAENGGKLPDCTPTERWEKAAKWAVMKKGRKRAVRLYDNEIDAQKHSLNERGSWVEHRPGESVRCLNYCAAAPWCDFAKSLSSIETEDGVMLQGPEPEILLPLTPPQTVPPSSEEGPSDLGASAATTPAPVPPGAIESK